MATVIALDASPASLLRAMRGKIVDAYPAYPEVLHVEIRDGSGGLWRFATQYADWSPADPAELIGRSVEDVKIDQTTGALSCLLSDGSSFEVVPGPVEASDDPSHWFLLTPDDLALEFGPGVCWQVRDAKAPHS